MQTGLCGSFSVENNPDTAFFTIHGKTGQIFTNEVLDHETKNQFVFSVVARDGGTPPRESAASVQVTQTLPVFPCASTPC